MFKIITKKNGLSEVLDTKDKSIDVCSDAELIEFAKLGIGIQGLIKIGSSFKSCAILDTALMHIHKEKSAYCSCDIYPTCLVLDGMERTFPFHKTYKNSEVDAVYLHYMSGTHIFRITEKVTDMEDYFYYPVIKYYAIYRDSKYKYRINATNYNLTARTRQAVGFKPVYIDLYSAKYVCYFGAVFTIDTIRESLFAIYTLKDGNVLLLTLENYTGEDEDGIVDADECHLYSFNFTTKKSERLDSAFLNDRSTVSSLIKNKNEVTGVYCDLDFCKLDNTPTFKLGNFIDKYSI